MRIKELEYESHQLNTYNRQLTEHMQRLDMEKDETILRHTRETADLLKRNSMLEERVKQLERGVKPVQDIMAGDFTGFENPTMQNHSWDDFSMVHGPTLQQECVQNSPFSG